MSQYWKLVSEWFDLRNERERILIIAVFVVAIISIWTLTISDQLHVRRERIMQQHATLKQQEHGLLLQINSIIARAKNDPNQNNRLNIAGLQNNIEQINEVLQKKMHGFVDPSKMATVLEDVLKNNSKLHLVQLKSMPAEFIVADASKKKEVNNDIGLYRHGFILELTGSYVQATEYLKALQELPWDFYWDGLDIQIIKYPQAKITLQLHTLSLKEGWIGV